MTDPANPFRAPAADLAAAQPEGGLPPQVVKQATNLTRDARLAFAVGLIPLLGLIFILRLVQWYQLRREYPVLISKDPGPYQELAQKFRSARSSLWFAVLLWPGVIVFCWVWLL